MLETTKIQLTNHAYLRYLERVHRTASREDVLRKVKHTPANRTIRNKIRKYKPAWLKRDWGREGSLLAFADRGRVSRGKDGPVFVCKFDRPGKLVVLTVLTKAMVEAAHKEYLLSKRENPEDKDASH